VSLKYSIEQEQETTIIALEGKITSDSDTGELLEHVQLQIEKKTKKIFFNLEKLDYISSSGLNFFVRMLTRSRTNQIELNLCALHGNVEKIFKISKLNEIFTIYPSLQEGIQKPTH
jgi:anti-sigma B factor antagonist